MSDTLKPSSNPKILVIFAHPNLDESRVHRTLLSAIRKIPEVTIVDLYQEYPDFLINVEREQARVDNHTLLVFQHPIYWYSCPPLLKEWMDAVLEKGWAYGKGADAMRGKDFLQVLSSGGPDAAYLRTGYNRFTIHELMRPFEATAVLCGWNYHHPYLVQGAYTMDSQALHACGENYHNLLMSYIAHGPTALDPLDTSSHS